MMTNPSCAYAVVSLTEIELEAQVRCARRQLVVIAPGLAESVARAVIERWRALGPDAVQVVLDPDPEVCRLGLGDLAALQILQEAAERIGRQIHQQQGLRVGVIVSDETTTVYSPTPRLIEAGSQPGERRNALRFDSPIVDSDTNSTVSDLGCFDLHPKPITSADVQKTAQDLDANPPVKFDVARKVRVFNARFEFVEFELHGLQLSRRRVLIPSDLMGLAKDPKAQKLLRTSFQLIEEDSEVSGDRVTRLKQFIVNLYLINLPGYGTIIRRDKKEGFQVAVKALDRYVRRFQRRLKKKLQRAIDANREILITGLLSGVAKNPPARWRKFLGENPKNQEIESMLRNELVTAFGRSDDLFREMNVKAIFKGVTYESLNDPDFVRIASRKMPSLDTLHEEYDAAKAERQRDERKDHS